MEEKENKKEKVYDYNRNNFESNEHYLSQWDRYSPEWMVEYKKVTGCEYRWYLPINSYNPNIGLAHIEIFIKKTICIFLDEGFFKGIYSNFIVMYFIIYTIFFIIFFSIAAYCIRETMWICRHGLPPEDRVVKDNMFNRFMKKFDHIFRFKYWRTLAKHTSFSSLSFSTYFWFAFPYDEKFVLIIPNIVFLTILLVSVIEGYIILIINLTEKELTFFEIIKTSWNLVGYRTIINVVFIVVFIYYSGY